MATQQVLFAETILGMKKAFKRKAYGKNYSPQAALGTAARLWHSPVVRSRC